MAADFAVEVSVTSLKALVNRFYAEVHRILGPGGRFVTGAVIDVDGGFTLGAADVLA